MNEALAEAAGPHGPAGRWHPLGPEWDSAWDDLAGADPASGFMQSSFWAAFKRAEGYETRRYGWFRADTGALAGGATLYAYPAPDHQPGMAVCPEGPVLPWGNMEETRAALRALLQTAKDEWPDVIGLRVEPHLPPPRPSVLRNWQRAPLDLTPVHTRLLDATLADDELLAAMRPKGRYNLRLSHRHGVTVRLSESMGDLRVFYDLFADTARRQDFFAEPYGFFLNLGAALFPGRHAALLLAEHEGDVLAAALVVFFGHRATYLYGGSSLLRRSVMPTYALHWAALQEARARGCGEYDFYGVEPYGDPNHLYAGFSTFKRQFGGRIAESMGAHDCLFYDRLAGHLIRRLPGGSPKA